MNEYVITSSVSVPEEDVLSKRVFFGVKRTFDVIISSVALILLLPIFFLIGLLIKIDSKGPIFFKHERIGKNGKVIYLYKFRSMVSNAVDLIDNFSEEQLKEFKENYKLKDDPRITKVGKILRKTSLDELPQLINILKGDMSLIGPRPIVHDELEKYGMLKSKFLSITPGLTGYWACNGRSDTTYDERIKLELYYVYNCSFKLDALIFINTVKSVLKRNGAC